jgi:hypothetical protein
MPFEAAVSDQIWSSTYRVSMGPLLLKARSTVVRLSSGLLWLHSPMPACEESVQELSAIGDVGFVVAPNLMHHLFYARALDAFPRARGYFAPGLEKKVGGLAGQSLADAGQPPWHGELESVFVAGLPVLNETVWFHPATGTLIVTDLLFCFGRSNPLATRAVARLLGVQDRLAMSRTMKWSVRGRNEFRNAIDRMMAWDVHRIVLAHDQIIEHDPKRKLADAFAWVAK